MTLSLIAGPPNSGKAGTIRERLEEAVTRDPVLVVPTLDDADRFERELCDADGEGRPVLGASTTTFERLFDEVARATGLVLRPSLSEVQALCVARRAAGRAKLGILARSAARPGFAPALLSLLEELQAACVDPATLAANAAELDAERGYLGEISALYGAYVDARDELGFGDAHTAAARATAALREAPDAWGARPVFVYGFDDLTVEQLELIDALAAAADVTVALAYEDRPALAARARTLGELQARGGVVEAAREPDPANTASPTLFHLERFFLADAPRRIEPDPGLELAEVAGERGQAEWIGAAIARLLADGVPADEIAVVVRSPDRAGPLYESVLRGFGIPVAVEARIPLSRTAVGRGLLALLRTASAGGRASDLLDFVRTPGVARSADADWLERQIRRDRLRGADEALAAWRGRPLFELEELRGAAEAGELLDAVSRFARRLAEYPHRGAAAVVRDEQRLEIRAAALGAQAADDLAQLPAGADPMSEAVATLEGLEVPLWRGSTEGHVRVTSPYRIRARRVRHLFVASLQEGEFPRHDAGEPFLSDDQRATLGLPERADPNDEERYLFYVCLSRPTEALHLCWRSCDDEGSEVAPSPFLDDVRELLEPPPGDGDDRLAAGLVRRRLGDVTLGVAQAPSRDELARSLAALGPARAVAALDEVRLPDDLRHDLVMRLERAGERLGRREPGPLTVPLVLEELRERDLFGASTLEEWALCSYRWFVAHELAPASLDPDPEQRAQGSVVHGVLEQLFRHPPAGPLPRPETLSEWTQRASELIDSHAAEQGLGGDDPGSIASRARMTVLVHGYLSREAASQTPLRPDPELLEASFGDDEESDRPPLDLGSFHLRGKIDRVDVPESGRAGLIRDYKLSRKVTIGANLVKEGKLQPQLYALALREGWERQPLGALYVPLAGTDEHRPRGIARADEADAALSGLGLLNGDLLPDAEFEGALDAAAERARQIVADMRTGMIDRDPTDDRCPTWCDFQAICRRERSARQEPEAGAEEEDEE